MSSVGSRSTSAPARQATSATTGSRARRKRVSMTPPRVWGMQMRDAGAADLPAIAAIYAAAATTSHATFDLEGRTIAWWQDRLEEVDPAAGHLVLVAVDGTTVLGYAKSGVHKEKPAYATTVETSVYVD